MPASLNSSDLERALRQKLRCRVNESANHIRCEVYTDEGVLVARTMLSHSWHGRNTPIGANMLSKIKRELYLPSVSDLIDLVSCGLTRERYLEIVLADE